MVSEENHSEINMDKAVGVLDTNIPQPTYSESNTKDDKKLDESVKEETEKEFNNNSSDFMGTESVGKVMWKLTYPSLIAKMTSALYAVCDSMFIGQLAGETSEERSISLSAVSLAMPIE